MFVVTPEVGCAVDCEYFIKKGAEFVSPHGFNLLVRRSVRDRG